jgi:hypothetical protein
MTTRIGAAAAAGLLVLGILVGVAGTIVVRDATTTDLADHMRDMSASAGSMGDMAGMMSMMGARDMAGMMSMMGTGDMAGMMGGSLMGPNASMTPGDHGSHHATPSAEPTR